MAKPKKSKALADLKKYRAEAGLNQAQFWNKLGSTQSAGSRYENERDLPNATAMLLVLQEQGKLTDEDLADALAVVEASR